MKAVITGAASGIGHATALQLARSGETVALTLADLDADGLTAAADEAAALGAKVSTWAGDLSDPESPAALVSIAADAMSGIDAVVSNAGILATDPLAELELADWDRTFAINTRAAWLLARSAYPHLKASRGALVATASISATHPTPPLGAYSASKAALVMLVQQLALEWGPDGIRANTVSPGLVRTGMTESVYRDPEQARERAAQVPLRRVAGPEDIARLIAFLLSDDADYVTGVDVLADGGLHSVLMPTAAGRR